MRVQPRALKFAVKKLELRVWGLGLRASGFGV